MHLPLSPVPLLAYLHVEAGGGRAGQLIRGQSLAQLAGRLLVPAGRVGAAGRGSATRGQCETLDNLLSLL